MIDQHDIMEALSELEPGDAVLLGPLFPGMSDEHSEWRLLDRVKQGKGTSYTLVGYYKGVELGTREYLITPTGQVAASWV